MNEDEVIVITISKSKHPELYDKFSSAFALSGENTYPKFLLKLMKRPSTRESVKEFAEELVEDMGWVKEKRNDNA